MKKPIDIEKLLQWAMRDELPRGRPVDASPWELIMRYGALGMRVDTSGPIGDYGFVPGEPHPDAVVIGAAIDALDQEARFEVHDEVLRMFGVWAPIAGDAADAILKASFDCRAIVMSKATLGSRPAWEFEAPTPYPVMVEERNARGELRSRSRVVGTDNDGDTVDIKPKRTARQRGVYDLAMCPRSPLAWGDPSMISVGHARAEYVAWHSALRTLADNLAGALDEFEPLPPSAAAEPWLTGQTPASRVLRGDDLVLDQVLPTQPKRPAPIRAAVRPYRDRTLTKETLAAQG